MCKANVLFPVFSLIIAFLVTFHQQAAAVADSHDIKTDVDYICEDTGNVITIPGIVVKSSKIPLTLAKIPQTVSIISIDDNIRSEFSSVAKIVSTVPGLRSFPTGNKWGDYNVDVRGFYGGGQSQYLLATLDDIPINNNASGLVRWNDFGLDYVSRIEVQKGPVSAQNGEFGFGGLVALYTRTAGSAPGSDISIKSGSNGAIGIVLNMDKSMNDWYLGTSVSRNSNDGWRKHSSFDSDNILVKLERKIGNGNFLKSLFLYSHADEEHPGAITLEQLNDDRTQAATDIYGNTIKDKNIADGCIYNLCYLKDYSKRTQIKCDLKLKYINSEENITTTSSLFHKSKLATIGTEAALGHKSILIGRELKFIGGISMDYNRLNAHFRDLNGSAPSSIVSGGIGQRTVLAIYTQEIYDLMDFLYLSTGIRFEYFYTEFEHRTSLTGKTRQTEIKKETEISPKLSLGMDISKNLLVYLSVSDAYKSPTLNHLYDAPPYLNPYTGEYVVISNNSLQSQKGICYDLGIKQSLGNLLYLNADYYYFKIRNEIDFDNATYRYNNIGKSTHSGFDLNLAGNIHKYYSCNFFYAFNSSKFNSGPYENNQINGVPKNQYGFSFGYDKTGKYQFCLTGMGRNRLFVDQANTIELHNSYEISISAGITLAGFNLRMNIDNLFNEEYCYSGYWDPLIEQARYYPAQERNIMIRLSRKF